MPHCLYIPITPNNHIMRNLIISLICLLPVALGVASCDEEDSYDPYYGASPIIFHIDTPKVDSAFLANVWIEAESRKWSVNATIDSVKDYDSKANEFYAYVDSSRLTLLGPAFKPMTADEWFSTGCKDNLESCDARIHMNDNTYMSKFIFSTVPSYGPDYSSIEIVRIEGHTFTAQHGNRVHIGVRVAGNGECEFFEMDVPERDW